MQRPFFFKYVFLAEGRPDGVRKDGTKRPKYGNGRPIWTRPNQNNFFQKTHLFFHVRPSICQNCFSSWHQKIRATGCAQTPCIFSHKCRNVQIFSPAAHYQKQAKILYLDTNCGSKAFLTHEILVMHLRLNNGWGYLIQHYTRQKQNVHTI